MKNDAAQSGRTQWVTLSTRILYRSRWLELRCDETVLPQGSRGRYDHVVVPGSATVLAVDEDAMVAVTRQWIYPHGQAQWRLPTGRIEAADASPEVAARRELREETGLSAARLRLLGVINGADSLTNHREHVFVAGELTQGKPELEPGEADLEVRWFPFDRVLAMVRAGQMPHAGSAFAVLSARVNGILDIYR
ncbi:NUDIX hydrolase [Streptomyces sp. SID13031]|uniref:NUDIX domain-containing protein n=1 Tax=Streptomyces sp. SID13031 TaxID=2706046 RepID=UPI0013C58B3F|nr:NUDIX hydrolase [Streptomyces sp. SID13031]NEA32813.1 NUDIX hydrolase [Streptomyces sp. SID13031]